MESNERLAEELTDEELHKLILTYWDHPRPQSWIDDYASSWHYPSRRVIIDVLKQFEWSTLVDLGCHEGLMLRMIKAHNGRAVLSGVEFSRQAVEAAQSHGLDVTRADLLEWLPTVAPKSYDVVMSHYALSYINPAEIEGVLGHILRITKKAVILAEATGPLKRLKGCIAKINGVQVIMPEYQHDYPQILGKLGVGGAVVEIDPPVQDLNAVTVVAL